MNNNIYTYEVWIESNLLAAIINCDSSGLSDEEEVLVAKYLSKLNGYLTLCNDSEESFEKCDISGLNGNCTKAIVNYKLFNPE